MWIKGNALFKGNILEWFYLFKNRIQLDIFGSAAIGTGKFKLC